MRKGLNLKREGLFGNTYIDMKRYYTGLVFIFMWLFIELLAMGGFIWECVDRGGFIIFAFITSVLLPLGVEIMLIIIFGSYITIDENSIRKYLFRVLLRKYSWTDIREVRQTGVYVYISLVELTGSLKEWDKKKYICLLNTDRLWNALKKNAPNSIIINKQ